jgi:hypothetical protein
LNLAEESRTSAGRLRALLTPRVLIAFGVSSLFFAALLLPRAADSRFVPQAFTNHARLAEIDRVELARFAEAAPGSGAKAPHGGPVTELSVGVRTVGELFRRVGAAVAQGPTGSGGAVDTADVGRLAADLRAQFRAQVLRGKTTELLALRSLQSQLFVRALRFGTGPAERQEELRELGGEFARLVDRGWLGGRARALDPATLRLLFRVRWGLLVGSHRELRFGPSLEEARAYYSFYMLHPPLDGRAGEGEKAMERLRFATALGQVDPEFPLDLAAGSLLLQADRPDLAAVRLRAHLEHSPSGPFAQLARNYFLFAMSGS